MQNLQKILKIDEAAVAIRLDVYLSRVTGASRRLARKTCSLGLVRVNGKRAPAGYLLQLEDEVSLLQNLSATSPRPDLVTREQRGSAVRVVFEDENFIAVQKPRAMHCLTLTMQDPMTLADWLASYNSAFCSASPDAREAGLVQRLDYFTSGIIIAAKSKEIWQSFRAQFNAERVEKSYLALVEGRFTARSRSLVIDSPLLIPPGSKKVEVLSEWRAQEGQVLPESVFSARSVISFVQELRFGEKFLSVLRVEGRSMRRHQVRAHLSSLGFPLLGDALYGAQFDGVKLASLNCPGFLLHAESIKLAHPRTGKELNLACTSQEFNGLLGK